MVGQSTTEDVSVRVLGVAHGITAAGYAEPSRSLDVRGRMRIGETARRAGVPAKTIRFWEDQGLLPRPARTSAGYRDYDPAIAERLAFIRHAHAARLSLHQIRPCLDIPPNGHPPHAPV